VAGTDPYQRGRDCFWVFFAAITSNSYTFASNNSYLHPAVFIMEKADHFRKNRNQTEFIESDQIYIPNNCSVIRWGVEQSFFLPPIEY
jgi:hypothetical protein